MSDKWQIILFVAVVIVMRLLKALQDRGGSTPSEPDEPDVSPTPGRTEEEDWPAWTPPTAPTKPAPPPAATHTPTPARPPALAGPVAVPRPSTPPPIPEYTAAPASPQPLSRPLTEVAAQSEAESVESEPVVLPVSEEVRRLEEQAASVGAPVRSRREIEAETARLLQASLAGAFPPTAAQAYRLPRLVGPGGQRRIVLHARGRNRLRQAILLSEALSRPRCFDV